MKNVKKMIASILLCLISFQANSCLLNENGGCESPKKPGFSIFYHSMGTILKVEKYDEYYSWYTTKDGKFLFLTFKSNEEYKRIEISKYYKWYCVSNFSSYCAPIVGMDGVVFNSQKNK